MVIKRVLLSVMVSLLLLVSASGVTVVQHYCHGRLMAESLYKTPPQCCGDSCPYCSDKVVSLRLSDSFQLSANYVDFGNSWLVAIPQYFISDEGQPLFAFNSLTISSKESPPLIVSQPALSKIQVYRI
ncbi:MAG TPA: hypothetical protein VMW01_04770 [Williamwhitmania sp.]|nr:hypothetical protein [Williamwhitmania sp.]